MAKKRQDGEYKRESLVTVELDAFQASLFAPEKLKDVETRTPGILAQARDDVMHMRSDGEAVWRCECGYRICRECFEVHSRHYAISVVDQR